MPDQGEMIRIVRLGASHYIRIPKTVMDRLCWRGTEILCLKCYGEKLVFDRVPVERLAHAPGSLTEAHEEG
jgi:antitoxin component of MazEF toxin-antitoxin module